MCSGRANEAKTTSRMLIGLRLVPRRCAMWGSGSEWSSDR